MQEFNSHQLVIIVGAARSGTKFLRDMLSASETVKCVPYDINYVWRYGNTAFPNDELPVTSASKAIADFILSQMIRLSGFEPENRGILLEKTVSNTVRIEFVRAMFPNAKFIHLIRNGGDVTESTIRQWHRPPDAKGLLRKLRDMPLTNYAHLFWFARNFIHGLISYRGGGKTWGVRYAGIENDVETRSLAEVCALQWKYSVDKAARSLDGLSPDQVLETRYEDIVQGGSEIDRLCIFLGVADCKSIQEFHGAHVRVSSPESWESRLSPEEVSRIREIIDPLNEKLGYFDDAPSVETKL